MKGRVPELQDNNKKVSKLKSQRLLEGYEDIAEVLYYQEFLYVPKVICSELISKHHNNPLTGNFGIEKLRQLIARKYYWPTLQKDLETYIKICDVYLALKAVCHKPYGDF